MAYEAKAAHFPAQAPDTFAGSFAPASFLDVSQSKTQVAKAAIATRAQEREEAEQRRMNRRPRRDAEAPAPLLCPQEWYSLAVTAQRVSLSAQRCHDREVPSSALREEETYLCPLTVPV